MTKKPQPRPTGPSEPGGGWMPEPPAPVNALSMEDLDELYGWLEYLDEKKPTA